ncbi:response regulator transcription factor [Chloroflexus sp. Y-396-1]|uniref:response regulator transcription factor n=1 Tax=Chloroflexus sp. Y-396-1 TaxID=867845 RepID=UPI00048D820B|nr:response regulator transcription factor [Chloroflexus sp. Y-396-1]
MAETLRVMIADDILPFVKGLKEMLSEIPDLELIGEAFTAAEAVTMAIARRPDVVMIDVSWKDTRTSGLSARQHHEAGLAAIERIKRQAPEVAILAMTAYTELIELARQRGADLAVPKELLNDFDQLDRLLRKAVDAVRVPRMRKEFESLTNREQRILEMMAKGLTDQEIASALSWGIGVIKRDVQTIYEKLDARNRAHAVARGYDLGLLQKGCSFRADGT